MTEAEQIANSLQLFGDRVLLEPIEQEAEKTESGLLYIPENAQKEPTQKGLVLAVGPDVSHPISPGDVVLHAKYGGTIMRLNGKEFLLLASRDLHAKVTE